MVLINTKGVSKYGISDWKHTVISVDPLTDLPLIFDKKQQARSQEDRTGKEGLIRCCSVNWTDIQDRKPFCWREKEEVDGDVERDSLTLRYKSIGYVAVNDDRIISVPYESEDKRHTGEWFKKRRK